MSKEIMDYGFGVIETRETYYTEQSVNELKQRITDLEAKLAEKEKEIEKVKHYNDRLTQGIYHSYGEHFMLKINQDKIELLEKVKNSVISTIELAESSVQAKDQVHIIIDTLIKEIKGE